MINLAPTKDEDNFYNHDPRKRTRARLSSVDPRVTQSLEDSVSFTGFIKTTFTVSALSFRSPPTRPQKRERNQFAFTPGKSQKEEDTNTIKVSSVSYIPRSIF